jgi:segregation and condensation protein A
MSEDTEKNGDAAAAWEEPVVEGPLDSDEALIVDVAGYEGPLDLLLALARTQKVDIAKISVVALVDQYLVFIAAAQKLRLEVAADYLVMAAWLAFLKSRLLLPREAPQDGEVSAEEMARRLSFRLMRLEAMRDAAAQLMNRMRLGRDVFQRGMPEGAKTIRETTHTATVYDLLRAYAEQRRRTIKVGHVVKVRAAWSIKDARQRLERLLGDVNSNAEWVAFEQYLEQILEPVSAEDGKTAVASSFGATLEMAREGRVEIRQDAPFAPIYMRPARPGAEWERVA